MSSCCMRRSTRGRLGRWGIVLVNKFVLEYLEIIYGTMHIVVVAQCEGGRWRWRWPVQV